MGANILMIYFEKVRFLKLTKYKIKCINDKKVQFFAAYSWNISQVLFFSYSTQT